MAGNHTLGTIRGTIEIDYDGAGIVKAIRDTDKVKKSHVDLDKSTTRILGTFAKFTKAMLLSGASSILTTGAIQGVAAVLVTLGPLVAAAFAAAPGLIAAFGAALVITKVALFGVGDALKAAAEGGDKFDKAMDKLAPQAQRFVKEYQKAVPVLGDVRKAIQDAFFTGTEGIINRVVAAASSLQRQAQGVAFAISAIAQNVVKFATSGRSIENVRKILSGLNAFLLRIRGSLGPVIAAFISLAAQVSGFGGVVGENLSGSLARFAAWLESIDVAKIFATAAPIIKSVGQFLSDVASIAGDLFSIFNVDGAHAAGVIGAAASQLALFLKTAQGQEALQAIGAAMNTTATVAGPVFLALLKALTPVFITLAPAVGDLAQQLASTLVPIINTLAPLLQALAGFLADNVSWIGPLIISVVALSAAYQVYLKGAKAVAVIQGILKAKALQNIGIWIAEKAAMVANGAAMVANAAVRAGTFVASFVASTAAMIAQRVAMIASVVAMGAVRAATIAWTVVQWALNSAFLANPITLTILLIVGLIAIIVKAWQTNETFRKVVLAVWAAIKSAIAAVGNWITGTLWPSIKKAWDQLVAATKFLVNAIVGYYTSLFNIGKAIFNALLTTIKFIFNAIVATVTDKINIVRAVFTAVTNAIKTLWNAFLRGLQAVASTVWGAIVAVVRGAINNVLGVVRGIISVRDIVSNAFNAARNAAANAIGSLISLARGIAGHVSGAIGNLGGLLRAKGQSLVQGFINGILSKIQAIKNAASQMVSAVTRFLPGSPAKEGPLSGRGYALLRARRMMADIAKGINDQAGLPIAAMSGAVTPMVRPLVSAGSAARSVASNTSSEPTTPRTFGPYNLMVDGKVISSIVIDTITGNPKTVAAANSEGSRQTSWSGSGR